MHLPSGLGRAAMGATGLPAPAAMLLMIVSSDDPDDSVEGSELTSDPHISISSVALALKH